MSEIVIMHASTPKRMKKLNDAIAKLKIPYEGKERKGYAPVFPYKAEIWIYKTKKEAVPEFLKFIKSNTSEMTDSSDYRPAQRVVNMLTTLLSAFSRFMGFLRNFKRRFPRFKKWKVYIPIKEETSHTIIIPDMKKVENGNQSVPGWGHSKVICELPDWMKSGEEEL